MDLLSLCLELTALKPIMLFVNTKAATPPKAMSVSFLSTTKMSCTRSALQWMSTFHGVLQKSIPPQMQFLPGVSVCRIVTMKCQLFPAWPHLLFHNLASEIVQAT